ncbi:hypothetical protein EH223_19320 [candidate division KSB1 bacterium]|nr:hypothetical protein [candidate division KSB1 bacterium]RQW00100.1 MAG: hypothetical protein EH223_19320 [candidate division KSB1 bacterium]
MAVELGGISLQHLTDVHVRHDTRVVLHPVPGMSGDLSQILGRPSVKVGFCGIFYGDTATDDLNRLRSAYLEQEPLDFFTESVGEGFFTQVLILKLIVTQRAGYLNQFDYDCEVMEYIEPPEPVTVDPLSALDSDLIGEATDFIDDVQNALEQVSQLTDLIANIPSFGDPTTRLQDMLDGYEGLVSNSSDGMTALKDILDLF